MSLLISAILTLLARGGPSTKILDLCHYGSDNLAQSNWTPFDGGLPAQAQEKGIKLPFNLVGNHPRAYWDRSLDVDLSHADRIRFSFFVQDRAKQSPSFSFYFQSEKGWYHVGFAAENGWNQITLRKAQFATEETPTGWNHITGIRLAAWKSVDAESKVGIADIEAITSDIVVVLGDRTPATSPEYAAVTGQSQSMARLLTDIGIEAGGITDTDVERGALEGRRIALFPHNPNMTDLEASEVEKFVRAGGRVIGFYGVHPKFLGSIGAEVTGYKAQEFPGQFSSIRFTKSMIPELPASVQQSSWNVNVVRPIRDSAHVIGDWVDVSGKALGIPAMIASDTGAYMSHVLLADDSAGKQKLMLALLGHFDPTVWKGACERAKSDVGNVGGFSSLNEAAAKLGPAATKEAYRAFNGGRAFMSQNKFAEAITLFQAARQALIVAYCASLRGKANEIHAVWCHSPFGVPGMSWDQVARRLADNGFNRVFPNMLWGGRAYYNSKLLPVDESVKTQGDQIANCIKAAKKHGLQVHVWKVNWNLGNAPPDFLARMRSEHRTQKDPTGKDIDWLCPSNPANFELERESMLEVVRNYPVDGIHFDYIRYPDSDGCYCDGCRKRFEESLEARVAHWPQDVISGDYAEKYRQFRRSNITKLVKAVSTEAHRIRPGIKVSAAVFADWPECRDTVGQDWVSWVKSGYLDFVCPMDYTGSAAQYDQWMSLQTSAIGPEKVFCPGVGVTLDTTLSPDQVARQIEIGRRYGTSGFILFNLNEALLNTIAPYLRMGITKSK